MLTVSVGVKNKPPSRETSGMFPFLKKEKGEM